MTAQTPPLVKNWRPPGPRARAAWRCAPCLVMTAWSLCTASDAHAEFGGSVSLNSDARYRGHSMSDEQPALSVDANYDDPSGVYVGGSVVAGA